MFSSIMSIIWPQSYTKHSRPAASINPSRLLSTFSRVSTRALQSATDLGFIYSLHADGLSADHIITLGLRGTPDVRIRKLLADNQTLFLLGPIKRDTSDCGLDVIHHSRRRRL
jgi:hypothetical protein